ncbi:MAG: CPBP family intramembrane metalloprotease [Lachnospiraceae bacterium]|nr:CPBP family intramembrane metalloprotease [Lachnospiraceae bacterium]
MIKKAKDTYSSIGMRYAIMYIVYYFIIMVILYIYKVVAGELPEGTPLYLTDGLVRFLLIYPLMLFLVAKKVPAFDMPKKKLGVKGFLVSFCIIFAFGRLSAMIETNIMTKITGNNALSNSQSLNIAKDSSVALNIIMLSIIVPIFEELLFRKFLVSRIVNYGEKTAILVSGIMFCLFHASPSQLTYTFVLGCMLAYLFIRTGNILYTIAIHILFNLAGTSFTMFMRQIADFTEMISKADSAALTQYITEHLTDLSGLIIYLLFSYLLIAVGIILAIVKRKNIVFENHPEEIEKGKQLSTAFLNAGMILYVVLFVAVIILNLNGYSQLDILYLL